MGDSTNQDHFVTTRWTQVLAAGGDDQQAQEALSDLCAAYYNPVVAFLRREGREEDSARELAHEFFAMVLAGDSFAEADPRKGRFRSYLLGALKHFAANRRARERTARRGGNIPHEPIHETDTTVVSPEGAVARSEYDEAAFDRDWAFNLLERAMTRLREEWVARAGAAQFEILKPWLTGNAPGESQGGLAAQLGTSEGAARVMLHRFRRRFGDFVKSEIAQTVDGPGEVADEMRLLIQAVAGDPNGRGGIRA